MKGWAVGLLVSILVLSGAIVSDASAAVPAVYPAAGSPPPIDYGGGVAVGGNGGTGTVDGTGSQGGGTAASGSSGATDCSGCTYTWTELCDPALDVNCGATAGCPAGFTMQTLIIRDPALPNPTVGATQCRSTSGVTPAQVQQAVIDRFSQLLTTAQPSHQPANGAIVNIPTLFATNTPQAQTFAETLLGVPVTLNVYATWTWDFGDGSTITTQNPGGAYPNTSLSHTYLQAAKFTVQLTTNWSGTFSFGGDPATAIPGGPIPRISNPLTLDVHEAHGVLVTG
jgi:hypothetical protein